MNACETWSTTQADEEKLLIFERRTLRKIHGRVRLQNGDYERRKNEDLKIVFNKPNIRLFPKAKRSQCTAGHVWRAVESLTRNVLIKSPQKK